MSIEASNRLKYIDVAKGIGIVLVVIGHISKNRVVTGIIYQFHMPLFFFISGYLFTIKENEKKYFYSKLKRLGIPYLSFLFIISILQFYNSFFSNETVLSFKNLMLFISRAVLGGRWLPGSATILWFISVLFIVTVLMNYLLLRISSRRIKILMLVFLVLGYINSFYFQNLFVPLNANVVLAACPLFYFGYLFKNYTINRFIYPSLLLILIAVFLVYENKLPRIDYNNAMYGTVLFSLMISLSFIVFVLKIAELLCSNFNKITNIFVALGQASLVIMFFHQTIQIYSRIYITDNVFVRVILAILVPFIIYHFAKKYKWGRILLIGSNKELMTTS